MGMKKVFVIMCACTLLMVGFQNCGSGNVADISNEQNTEKAKTEFNNSEDTPILIKEKPAIILVSKKSSSIQCESDFGLELSNFIKDIEDEGLELLSVREAESDISIMAVCGSPAMQEYVFEIDSETPAADLIALKELGFIKYKQDLRDFSQEENLVLVMKSKRMIQCDSEAGISLGDHLLELTDENINPFVSELSNDGMLRAQQCGKGTGDINTYLISKNELDKAKELGFVEVQKSLNKPTIIE